MLFGLARFPPVRPVEAALAGAQKLHIDCQFLAKSAYVRAHQTATDGLGSRLRPMGGKQPEKVAERMYENYIGEIRSLQGKDHLFCTLSLAAPKTFLSGR